MRTVHANIGKGRLEAFSDGVIAIIITIMVLELKVPKGHTLNDLKDFWPVFVNYIMSFVYVGIYWNNHHHMFHIVKSINGTILWANLHLLFWLSMVPFVSSWMGETKFADATWPMATYGIVLFMNAISYTILVMALIKHEGEHSALAIALGDDWKGKASLIIYAAAIGMAFLSTIVSFALYVVVACIWFIPDRRIEKKLADEQHKPY